MSCSPQICCQKVHSQRNKIRKASESQWYRPANIDFGNSNAKLRESQTVGLSWPSIKDLWTCEHSTWRQCHRNTWWGLANACQLLGQLAAGTNIFKPNRVSNGWSVGTHTCSTVTIPDCCIPWHGTWTKFESSDRVLLIYRHWNHLRNSKPCFQGSNTSSFCETQENRRTIGLQRIHLNGKVAKRQSFCTSKSCRAVSPSLLAPTFWCFRWSPSSGPDHERSAWLVRSHECKDMQRLQGNTEAIRSWPKYMHHVWMSGLTSFPRVMASKASAFTRMTLGHGTCIILANEALGKLTWKEAQID